MALYRQVFRTENRWTFLIDGTARAGIEASMVSILEPGDRVLVPIFRPLRPPEARDRDPRRRGGARDRGGVGHGVRPAAGRRGDRPGAPEAGRPVPGRHLHDDVPAARRDRPDLPRAGRPALCRRHRLDRRQPAGGRRLADRRGDLRPSEMPRRTVGVGADHLQRSGGGGGPAPPPHRGGHPPGRLRAGRGAAHRLETISTSPC